MSLGFVLYFGYGMWNSSEEYVSKGKIPPGGLTPLPKTAFDAEGSTTTVTDSVELAPVPAKLPLKRTLPVTSLDDDDETHTAKVAQKEDDENVAAFVLAIENTHLEAKEVFDKAKMEREQAAFLAAILHSHELSEKIFHQLKADKETEQLEMQKQMAVLAEQSTKLHETLEQIFANIGKNQPPIVTEEEIKPKTTVRQAGPLSAVMDELKTKTAIVDGAEEAAEVTETRATVPETVVVPPDDSPVESGTPIVSGTDSPGRASNSSSKLMLDELKKAINIAVKIDDGDDGANISPSAVAQRRDSPSGFTALNDSAANDD